METLKLSSGFTVQVKTLGPYALDHLYDKHKDPGPIMRVVKLAAGDVDYWPYDPPAAPPDKDTEPEEYELYMRWLSRETKRKQIYADFIGDRRDFLLLNCVSVVDGPVDVDSDEWLGEVTVFGVVPENASERRLLFLKTQVIRTAQEYEDIVRVALAQEVSIEDILRAMENMNVSWDGVGIREAVQYISGTRGKHSTRVWEIQAADRTGMSLEEWYTLPLCERAARIAANLAPEWLAALEAKAAQNGHKVK